MAVEKLEETTRYGYYRRDLPKFCAILSHSVRALEMLEERIHEDRDVRGANRPPHNILGHGQRLSQTSVASRNLIERLAHPRNLAREQELPLPELCSELLDRLRRIGQNHGQDGQR
ncbi:unnamed protein product [Lasius platythorax]|uniref:Uncharacterized protein n=1 Tax=Lasius platythorax TaxID=488582 RepID=A0AAV2NM15_9HYME